MEYLIAQLIICGLIGAAIGFLAAWIIRGSYANQERESLSAQLAAKDRQYRQLDSDCAQLKKDIVDRNSQLARQQAQLTENAVQQESLQADLESRDMDLLDASAAVTDSRRQIAKLEFSYADLEKRFRETGRDLTAALADVDALRARLTERESALAELESAQEHNESEIQSLRMRLNERDGQLTRLNVALDARHEELNAAREDRRQLEARLADASDAVRDLQRELAASKDDAAKLEAKISSQEATIAQLRAELRRLRQEQQIKAVEANTVISDLQGKIRHLERAATEKDQTNRQARDWAERYPATAPGISARESQRVHHQAREIERLRGDVESAETADRVGRPSFLLRQRPDRIDDLKRISGIGPMLERMLNDLGIYRFEQLAQLTDDHVVWLAAKLAHFPDRILRDRWVGQARELSASSRQ